MNPLSEETGQSILGVLREIRDDQKQALALARRVGAAPDPAAFTPFSEDEIRRFGEHGDPVIKFDPKRWNHPSIAGLAMSQIPSDVLVDYARSQRDLADWYDRENKLDGKGNPKSRWARLDVRKALFWSEKNRDKNQVVPEVVDGTDEDGGYADVPS